jgi:large conductance mechanosensitive channel
MPMDPLKKLSEFQPAKKALTLWGEFRQFAFKGNVIDLAVAVIIGAAFGKIIDSLVKDIIMPLVSLLLPEGQGYQDWKITVHGVVIPYGHFLAELVNFLVVAFAVYVVIVKFLGWIMRMREAEEAKALAPVLTKQEELLVEIRDLLRQQVQEAPHQPGVGPEAGGGGVAETGGNKA